MCREYSSVLQQRLMTEGIDLDTALIGGSYLRRAQQTASLLFPNRPIQLVPHITEPGALPVNTPAGGLAHPSSWPDALVHLANTGKSQFVIVSHGNFMRYTIWQTLTSKPSTWMANLDTLIIRGVLTPGGHLLQATIHRIPYDGRLNHDSKGDFCSLPRHLLYIHRLVRRTKAQQLLDMERANSDPGPKPNPKPKYRGSRKNRPRGPPTRRTRRRPATPRT